MAEKPNTVKYELKFPDGFKPTYASGVIGHVTPRGELFMHFFVEQPALPRDQTFAVHPDGRLGQKLSPDTTQAVFEQVVNTGVILSRQGVRDLYAWLGDRVRELEQQDVARIKIEAASEDKH